MRLSFGLATPEDAPALVELQTVVADRLTREHGRGHWSSAESEGGTLRAIQTVQVLVARRGKKIVGSLRLATKKPWAIDVAYFTRVERALYLLNMAVAPDCQGQGVGRRLVEEAIVRSREFPAQAIRLDAYDAAAGAGGFYARCGFEERGRVTYRGVPLIYYEMLLG